MNNNPKKVKMQGKTSAHAKAVLRSLLIELIRNERVQTTPKKAKMLKREFDRIINRAKKGTDASRRNVASAIRNEKAEQKLFASLLDRLKNDNSGYTLSARTLPRKGDNAEQMIVLIKGAEIKQRRSRLESALQRRDKKEEDAQSKGVTGRLRGARSSQPKNTKKKESKADTRRVST